MADQYLCRLCRKTPTATKAGRYRTHTNGKVQCENSGMAIPPDLLAQEPESGDPGVPKKGKDFETCPECRRNVELTPLGYFKNHNTTLYGGDRCKTSGVRAFHAGNMTDVPLPGDEKPKPGAMIRAAIPLAETISPAPTSTSAPAESSRPALPPGSGTTECPPPKTSAESGKDSTPTAEALLASPEASTGTGDATTATPSESTPLTPDHLDHVLKRDLGAVTVAQFLQPGSLSSGKGQSATSPESTTTSKSSPQPGSDSSPTEGFSLGPVHDERFRQPGSPFLQPGVIPPRVSVQESMTDRGREIAARLRETFYAYTNRNSSDNRSAQTTIGPSEAGSPCDRQLAMKLLGIKAVNPQEGWAPFVGTAVHVELAKMFEWANGSNAGRYETEMPLRFGSDVVPRGTADLLDRVLFILFDHKLMGRWSLDNLIKNGPSETYRIQGQIYGLGASLAGEKVREIAIIGWPRQESSLDKLYVHVEKYDRKIAEAAIKRVAKIAEAVKYREGADPMLLAKSFPVGDDCKWCPFHLKGDKRMERGCPGK